MRECWLRLGDFQVLRGKFEDGALIPEGGEVVLRAAVPKGWPQCATAAVHVKAIADHQPLVRFGLCQGEGKPCLEFHYRILANCHVQAPYPLDERALNADFAFLPPWPGAFKGGVQGRPMKADEVQGVLLTVEEPSLARVELEGVHFLAGWTPESVRGEPLVDELGQRKAGGWPGKTMNFDELKDYLAGELAWAQTGNRYPEGWSRYGGWTRKRFEATGWFHTAHDGRRWWLVDPEGCAFFSNGMCYGSRTGVYAMADHLEALYEWLPPRDGLLGGAWTTGDQIPLYVARNGLESAKRRTLVNFARANMMRAFGKHWLEAWISINAARLRAWGVNTLGVGVNDYGDEHTAAFLAQAKIPYVITLQEFPLTEQRVFRDFPDVFSDEYATLAAKLAREQLDKYRDDPYLIGYFVTNEPEWLMCEDVNLAERLLACVGCAASKNALIEFLKAAYPGIQVLNAAWDADFSSFDALQNPWHRSDLTAAAQKDLEAFHLTMVERYGRVVSEALRAADPHHLNLGMRYSQASAKTLCGPMRYFDVFSFNHYGAEPAAAARLIAAGLPMPMMVGEWHVGAQDSGLDAWGLYYATTQAQRAQAVAYYLEQSTQDENLVGAHYFEYGDQPYLGRFDGECYNIGLIDVCNRPYPLVAEAFRSFAQRMYSLLDGQIAPAAPPVDLKSIWNNAN